MNKSILAIPIMTILMWVSILLDIFVLRQVLVFCYLSFVPGFAFFKILKQKETTVLETVLFSVGLSIAFLMFLSLVTNEVCLLMGFSKPLTIIPLTIVISISTLALFFVGCKSALPESRESYGKIFVSSKGAIVKLAVAVLPLVGIVGALYSNVPVIAIMVITIAALYVVSTLSTKFVSCVSYPFLIFVFSLALAIQVSLTSKYIIGYDSQLEYYVFKLTANNGFWHLLPASLDFFAVTNYNSMLSITILPTVYSVLMNTGGEIVFKTLYPFIFTLVPLTLFYIYKRQMGNSLSFFSVLLFISGSIVFYGIASLSVNRQIIGEFFFVLSLYVILEKRISHINKSLLVIIFGASLVVSHYSLMYIYLLCVATILLVSKMKHSFEKMPNTKIVLLLFILAFSWYNFSVSPLTSFSQLIRSIVSRFSTDLFQSAARSSFVFGSHPAFGSMTNLAGSINWLFFLAVHLLVSIGIIGLLLGSGKTKLDPKFRILCILGALLLFLSFAIPNFAPSLNLTRFYGIAFLLLASCFALGSQTLYGLFAKILRMAHSERILRKTLKRIGMVLLCVVLVGYFLSQTGVINLIAGAVPLSYSLDLERTRNSNDRSIEINFHSAYIVTQEVFGAYWLKQNMNESSIVYADAVSEPSVLTSYGLISGKQLRLLTNSTLVLRNGYIFLNTLNVVGGVVITDADPFDSSELSHLLNESNLLYSNGNSEIWRANSPYYLEYFTETP